MVCVCSPVTCKLRMGRDDRSLTALRLFPLVQDWGAAAVTVRRFFSFHMSSSHCPICCIACSCTGARERSGTRSWRTGSTSDSVPRLSACRSSATATSTASKTCVCAAPFIVVTANLSCVQYEKAKAAGVTATMVGRGALIKPWLFTEIKERRHWDISAGERLDLMRDFVNYGLEHWGSDNQVRVVVLWKGASSLFRPVCVTCTDVRSECRA